MQPYSFTIFIREKILYFKVFIVILRLYIRIFL